MTEQNSLEKRASVVNVLFAGVVGVTVGFCIGALSHYDLMRPTKVFKDHLGNVAIQTKSGAVERFAMPEGFETIKYRTIEYGKPERVEITTMNKGSKRAYRVATVSTLDGQRTLLIEERPDLFYTSKVNP
jgi:hypothetical protein